VPCGVGLTRDADSVRWDILSGPSGIGIVFDPAELGLVVTGSRKIFRIKSEDQGRVLFSTLHVESGSYPTRPKASRILVLAIERTVQLHHAFVWNSVELPNDLACCQNLLSLTAA
jgi:hypothetical protein